MAKEAKEKKIGAVTHYYGKLGVGIVKLSDNLKVGDSIHVVGAHADFTQAVDSMQYEHKPLASAKKGQEIGIKTTQKVHEGDDVFLAA